MRSCVLARVIQYHISAQCQRECLLARWLTTICLLWYLIQSISISRLLLFLPQLLLSWSLRMFAHKRISWSLCQQIWMLFKLLRCNWLLIPSLPWLILPIVAKRLLLQEVLSMSKLLVLPSGIAWQMSCWANSQSVQTLRLSIMVSKQPMWPLLLV